MATLVLYLLQSSLCLAAFALLYRWFLQRSTHFSWMRLYLLASVALGLLLPLMPFPTGWWVLEIEPVRQLPAIVGWDSNRWLVRGGANQIVTSHQLINWPLLILYLVLSVYAVGLLHKTYQLGRNLSRLRRLIGNYPQEKKPGYRIITATHDMPISSFLNCMFLPPAAKQLSEEELKQIEEHELVHIRQRHSWDLLFLALAGIVLWFHPLMNYLQNALRAVHEYLADASVAGQSHQQKAYARLLLKISTQRTIPLATAFAGKQINRRIAMLSRSRSPRIQKLVFTLILPMATSLLVLFSCVDEPPAQQSTLPNPAVSPEAGAPADLVVHQIIGKIRWKGNTLYDDETLNETLGLKSGDAYDRQILDERLIYDFNNPTRTDVSSLYMDRGYLFFNLEVEEQVSEAGKTNLLLKVYEGNIVRLSEIIIRGNGDVPEEKVRQQIALQPREVFNRSKLIKAQRAVAEMGYFDPKEVGINPLPDELGETVAIEFVLTPLTSHR